MEVHHQRAFSAEPLQTAMVDFTMRTRGVDHLSRIVTALRNAGYRTSLPDRDVLPRLS